MISTRLGPSGAGASRAEILVGVASLKKYPRLSYTQCCNPAGKPRNWATFDPGAAGKKVPRFADPITLSMYFQWAYRKLGYVRRGLAKF